jgi:hypothetical protein
MTSQLQLPSSYQSEVVRDAEGINQRIVLVPDVDGVTILLEYSADDEDFVQSASEHIPNILIPALGRLLALYHDDLFKLQVVQEDRPKARLSDLFGVPCPRCSESLVVVGGSNPNDLGFGCMRCSSGMKMYGVDYFLVSLLRALQQEQQDDASVRIR